jgi:hypothetical protein
MAAQEPFRSLEWMHRLRDAEIRPELRALGFLMMSYANVKGELRPTQEQLAARTPAFGEDGETVSTKTIQRRRSRLERLGWVQCVEKGKGRGRASVYRLSFPSEKQDTLLSENRTGVSDQERHQEQVQEPAGEKGQVGRDEGHVDQMLAALEQRVGQTISPSARRVLHDALLENESGVLASWERARTGSSPIGLLVHMIRNGEHRAPELRFCPACGEQKPDVQNIAPLLEHSEGLEILACRDCARGPYGVEEQLLSRSAVR